MKLKLLLSATCIIVCTGMSAQHIVRLKGGKLPVVCHAEHNSHIQTRREAPEAFKKLSSGARIKASDIEVTYFGFPASAQAAFEHAVSIWESLLSSPVKIRIAAQWSNLQAGVLGSAGPGFWAANFEGAPDINIYYPGALAEKLARTDLNAATEYDIVAQFNSGTDWYFETTGTPANGQYDFITVVLHELGHGLGFTSTFTAQNGVGFYGDVSDGIPFPFDVAIINADLQNLYRSFDSPSAQMAAQLTGGQLFFNSPSFGGTAQLFAPATFSSGSSIAHLDRDVFPQGDANSLMRPVINSKEVNHDPGPAVQAIFTDMGWVSTYIDHDHLKDRENTSDPVVINALVEADGTQGYSFDPAQVYLVYFSSQNATPTEVQMTSTGTPHEFSATLPAPGTSTTYSYYIRVKDSYDRILTRPGNFYAPTETLPLKGPSFHEYTFRAGADTNRPVLTHTPREFVSYLETSLVIEVTVEESSTLAPVELEFIYNDGTPQVSTMALVGTEQNMFNGTTMYRYRKTIPFSDGQLNDGDEIKYRITTHDNAAAQNEAASPAADYHIVPVKGLAPPRTYYTNNFNTPSDDFIGADFSITTPEGFDDPAIHSTHPYPAAGNNNNTLDLTYQLRVPVIVSSEDPFMSFDEVVLAEPGEEGTTFTDQDFYDYVIVEGSRNAGASWVPLVNGYDSRDYGPWLTRYNSATTGGDAALYRPRTIDLAETFSAGDEIVIRFRLHSDPFESGWGWAIDNLMIQVDNVPPEIIHNHFDYVIENTASLPLLATITDDLQLDKLVFEYKTDDNEPQTEELALDGTSALTDFTLDISNLAAGQTVYYRYAATDSAGNTLTLPAEGFLAVPVLAFNETVSQYANDFNTATDDFAGNFFTVTQPVRFDNAAINTPHPYPAGFGFNKKSDFTYTFKKKVKINESNPYIQFNEVCLVQTHADGAVFNTAGYNDYVVTEASADKGGTWHALTEGYDATDQAGWLGAYQAGSEGYLALYKRRTINMLANEHFTAEDTLLIRFRLFSDETATAWGWAIDDLHIQDIVTSVETDRLLEDVDVYPNPLTGGPLTIGFPTGSTEPVTIRLLNSQGMLMTEETVRISETETKSLQLDLSGYANGLYLLRLRANGKWGVRKVIVRR